MTAGEKTNSESEREALVFILALRKFPIYMLSSEPFTSMTDQKPLKSAYARKVIHGCIARWLDFFAEYNFEFQYRSGKSNNVVDFL